MSVPSRTETANSVSKSQLLHESVLLVMFVLYCLKGFITLLCVVHLSESCSESKCCFEVLDSNSYYVTAITLHT